MSMIPTNKNSIPKLAETHSKQTERENKIKQYIKKLRQSPSTTSFENFYRTKPTPRLATNTSFKIRQAKTANQGRPPSGASKQRLPMLRKRNSKLAKNLPTNTQDGFSFKIVESDTTSHKSSNLHNKIRSKLTSVKNSKNKSFDKAVSHRSETKSVPYSILRRKHSNYKGISKDKFIPKREEDNSANISRTTRLDGESRSVIPKSTSKRINDLISQIGDETPLESHNQHPTDIDISEDGDQKSRAIGSFTNIRNDQGYIPKIVQIYDPDTHPQRLNIAQLMVVVKPQLAPSDNIQESRFKNQVLKLVNSLENFVIELVNRVLKSSDQKEREDKLLRQYNDAVLDNSQLVEKCKNLKKRMLDQKESNKTKNKEIVASVREMIKEKDLKMADLSRECESKILELQRIVEKQQQEMVNLVSKNEEENRRLKEVITGLKTINSTKGSKKEIDESQADKKEGQQENTGDQNLELLEKIEKLEQKVERQKNMEEENEKLKEEKNWSYSEYSSLQIKYDNANKMVFDRDQRVRELNEEIDKLKLALILLQKDKEKLYRELIDSSMRVTASGPIGTRDNSIKGGDKPQKTVKEVDSITKSLNKTEFETERTSKSGVFLTGVHKRQTPKEESRVFTDKEIQTSQKQLSKLESSEVGEGDKEVFSSIVKTGNESLNK